MLPSRAESAYGNLRDAKSKAMRDDKDRSSKWMIEHHGDSILRLAGVSGFREWRSAQADLVQPRQLPDGLLEVLFPERDNPDPFLLEIATYPEQRVADQAMRDALVVLLARRVVPEVITLVLHPKGNLRITGSQQQTSPHGLTQVSISWRVVELWTLPAESLLAANDVGLIPWVPLAQTTAAPDVLIHQCRERIDQQAAPDERANLLAVTQVMARLRYNDLGLLKLLGGSEVMIESPLIVEMMAQNSHEIILNVLESRLGTVPPEISLTLRGVLDRSKLTELARHAGTCPDLAAFHARLAELA